MGLEVFVIFFLLSTPVSALREPCASPMGARKQGGEGSMAAGGASASVGGPILAPRGGIGAGEGQRRCGPGWLRRRVFAAAAPLLTTRAPCCRHGCRRGDAADGPPSPMSPRGQSPCARSRPARPTTAARGGNPIAGSRRAAHWPPSPPSSGPVWRHGACPSVASLEGPTSWPRGSQLHESGRAGPAKQCHESSSGRYRLALALAALEEARPPRWSAGHARPGGALHQCHCASTWRPHSPQDPEARSPGGREGAPAPTKGQMRAAECALGMGPPRSSDEHANLVARGHCLRTQWGRAARWGGAWEARPQRGHAQPPTTAVPRRCFGQAGKWPLNHGGPSVGHGPSSSHGIRDT